MRHSRDDQRSDPSRLTAQAGEGGFSDSSSDDVLPITAIIEPSAQSHRVVVYSSDEAVPSQRFVAYITVPTRAPKTGITSERRLGISFPAADYNSALQAAAAFWQTELDRERRKIEAATARGEALTARREGRAGLADANQKRTTP